MAMFNKAVRRILLPNKLWDEPDTARDVHEFQENMLDRDLIDNIRESERNVRRKIWLYGIVSSLGAVIVPVFIATMLLGLLKGCF